MVAGPGVKGALPLIPLISGQHAPDNAHGCGSSGEPSPPNATVAGAEHLPALPRVSPLDALEPEWGTGLFYPPQLAAILLGLCRAGAFPQVRCCFRVVHPCSVCLLGWSTEVTYGGWIGALGLFRRRCRVPMLWVIVPRC